jgi:hypothetical protein
MIAIGVCGLMIGGVMSVFGAAPATARLYSGCDNKIDKMEQQAARDYAKGKLTDAEYANVQAEIAYHHELWGC